jgi:hypothetical protein
VTVSVYTERVLFSCKSIWMSSGGGPDPLDPPLSTPLMDLNCQIQRRPKFRNCTVYFVHDWIFAESVLVIL